MFGLGLPRTWQPFRKVGCALALVLATAATTPAIWAKPVAPPPSVALSDLPAEARETDRLVRSGGPFPYAKDGTVFANRERRLPEERRGYYREYTVPTPRAANRGARRLICGGAIATRPETCFYTGDHYASFSRISR